MKSLVYIPKVDIISSVFQVLVCPLSFYDWWSKFYLSTGLFRPIAILPINGSKKNISFDSKLAKLFCWFYLEKFIVSITKFECNLSRSFLNHRSCTSATFINTESQIFGYSLFNLLINLQIKFKLADMCATTYS